MSIKVCVIEDDAGTREGLKALLDRRRGMECIGMYPTAEEALQRIQNDQPDVVLVDINLPRMSGIECVSRLREILPRAQILILTVYDQDDLIFEALCAGAHGYILKNASSSELIEAIEQVHAGGAPMSMRIARKVVKYFQGLRAPHGTESLTPREREILRLLAKGYLYKEIADKLGLSISTVRAHLHSIYEKLHVHTRTEAVLKYLGRS